MSFKMKYPIRADYIRRGTKRRSGARLSRVLFLVSHDTGNDGSTAQGNVNYYKNSANQQSASAHLFVDDKEIIECVPAVTGTPEKAWHVLYNRPKDNQMYGDDANDAAIGVELCYSWKRGSIDNQEAYKRYVWLLAYLCYKFGLHPAKHITGHQVLDPGRKTDPDNALKKYGKNLNILIQDVVKEYNECYDKGYLEEGDRGEEVKKLQQMLNAIGIDAGEVDGIFGGQTKSAVILFQKRKDLTPDGLAGKNTMDALNKIVGEHEEIIKAAAQTHITIIQNEEESEMFTLPESLQPSVSKVLLRFANKEVHGDKALDTYWRERYLKGEMTQNEAIGLIYTALERGLVIGDKKE